MSKFSKTILIITVIGIALCSIGLAFGANYGIYLNKTGWHPVPKVAKEITRTFEDVKTINANYQNSAIEVIPGSEFSVTAKYAFAEPQIVYENGTLTIDSSENHTWFNIGFMFTVEKLTITVPGNASLDGINIYNDNGSIKVSNKIFAKNFVIQNDNGSIKIDGVTAEEAKVRNKNGSIALANFAGINCKVSNDNGAIKLENFASVTGGFTQTGRYSPNVFNITPNEVYRVYADGRPDELVRGVDLVGTPLAMFSQIGAAGGGKGFFMGMCGAESGSIPVSCISPMMFVRQIEIQKRMKSQSLPPLLPKP